MGESVSILILFFFIGSCLALPPLNVRIIGGESAKPGQFPFIAALKNGDQFCDGSIINKNWVLTAAHCLEGKLPDEVTILVGTNLLNSGGTFYNVTKLIYHSQFSVVTMAYDIGLIQIDGEFEFNDLVQPIQFGYADANDTVIVSGWGVADDGYPPEDLRYLKLRALSIEECQQRARNYIEELYLGPEQVCALVDDGYKGPCFGDSGGPLVANGKLVGIVSYAFFACGRGVPDVYTRPSAYNQWIEENMYN